MKTFQDFLHIMDFNGNQMVQGPKDCLVPCEVPSEVLYMEKNPGIFSSKTLISFRLMDILDALEVS